MTIAAQFARLIDKQLGVVGNRLGQPFSVYRINPASNGDFPGGWQLVSSRAHAHRNRVRSQDAEVAMTSERTLWYEIVADMSPFWLGDVFIATDPPYFPGIAYGDRATNVPGTVELNGFALAWHAPMRPPLAGRIDHRCRIYRPALTPQTVSDGSPLTPSQQWRTTHEFDTPLLLANGVYSFGAPAGGFGSLVPCGFGTSDRQTRGEDMAPDPPGMLPVPRYYIFLPPLPGYTPSEGDALITEDDARYTVIAPYSQATGVVGSQLMVQRYISQAT
jgi:hypothetical protein